jgi:hypothetical protein
MYGAVLAFVEQLRIHHPDWLVPNPDLRGIQQDTARRRMAWEAVKANAAFLPMSLPDTDRFFRDVTDQVMQAQRITRELRRAGRPLPSPLADPAMAAQFQPLVDGLPPPEAYWRQTMAAAWWHGAVEGDRQLGDLRDWLLPRLKFWRLDAEAWMRFWLQEADGAALVLARVQGLIDFFQPDRRINSGNWGDIVHAAVAVDRDYMLTADGAFHEALLKVRRMPATRMASPLLVRRAAPDIVSEIKSVLRW